ncbi:MAG: PilZ domain-containing protein [Terriglobales bacterium]
MNIPFTSTRVPERAQTGEEHEHASRRRFPRYRTNLPVRVRDRQERAYVGHCFVIAEAGLGASLPEPISVGSMVQLLFAVPGQSTPLKVLALVRNQIDREHGFEFLSLTDADRQSIKEFCDQLAMNQRREQYISAHV